MAFGARRRGQVRDFGSERMTNSRRTIATVGTIAAIAIAATSWAFVRSSFEPPSTSHGPAVNDRDPGPSVPAPTVGYHPGRPVALAVTQTLLLSAGLRRVMRKI